MFRLLLASLFLLTATPDGCMETSICDVYCTSDADCIEWGGICVEVDDGYQVRNVCTEDCNHGEDCSEPGWGCIPMWKGGMNFNWQCLPNESPVCGGY